MVTEHSSHIPKGIERTFVLIGSHGQDHPGKPGVSAQAFDERQNGGRPRALIVDDNPTNARVLAGLVEDRQFDFVVAPDGEHAVERFKVEKFALVLMDIHMPNVDGLEAARQMREFEFEADRPHTPILAVTAYDDPSVENSCEAVGMDGFIAKPISPAILDRFLDIWID